MDKKKWKNEQAQAIQVWAKQKLKEKPKAVIYDGLIYYNPIKKLFKNKFGFSWKKATRKQRREFLKELN